MKNKLTKWGVGTCGNTGWMVARWGESSKYPDKHLEKKFTLESDARAYADTLNKKDITHPPRATTKKRKSKKKSSLSLIATIKIYA